MRRKPVWWLLTLKHDEGALKVMIIHGKQAEFELTDKEKSAFSSQKIRCNLERPKIYLIKIGELFASSSQYRYQFAHDSIW